MVRKMLLFLLSFVTLLSCGDDEKVLSSAKDILSFSIEGQVSDSAYIDTENATITVVVDSTADLTSIVTTITVSDGAIVSPASGSTIDYTESPVEFTVTAEDQSVQKWMVTVTKEQSNEAEITAFYNTRLQDSEAEIGDSTVYLVAKTSADLTGFKPTIEISDKATISPASGETVDFTNSPVIYTVTAESGITKKWYVTVVYPQEYEANILTFTIPNQIGESVFKSSSIYIDVAKGYDLTNVTPTFTITEGTTVSPAQGEAVDFSGGYVDYVVTTTANTMMTWRVYVSEYMYKAYDPAILYMGRVDFTDTTSPKMWAPGTSISAKFTGTYCDIIINDKGTNYLEIVVDDVPTRILSAGGYQTLKNVSGLSDGEHTLMLTKDTEASIGALEFVGLRCDGLLTPDALPTRKMEFIGNSITCGTGSDTREVACGAGVWKDQHNAYLSYGPETARRLNAQWMLSSYSGVGVIQSCCDLGFVISDIYEKLNLKQSGDDWDFSQYEADIVTICLGQNDGIQDSVQFCSAYVNFIGTIRSKYPDAEIICLTSPMADASLRASQKSYLTGIVNYMNNNGDSHVYKFFFSQGWNSGCDSHPDLDEHQLIADELEDFIKTQFGW